MSTYFFQLYIYIYFLQQPMKAPTAVATVVTGQSVYHDVSIVFPPAPKKCMVKFPRKGHFKRATTGKEGTFEHAVTG